MSRSSIGPGGPICGIARTSPCGRGPDDALQAITQATSWPAETHIIHIVHPAEQEPELSGELRLVDVETEETRRMWLTKRELLQYRAAFTAYRNALHAACMQRQIDYVMWTTDQVFEEMFLQLLSRGSALAGA